MALSSTLPAFVSHGGHLEAFDDGHCPETFRFQQIQETNNNLSGSGNAGDVTATPRIVKYDQLAASASSAPPPPPPSNVHVYDDVLNPNNARMLYAVTASSRNVQRTNNEPDSVDVNRADESMNLEGESPWGTYVTLKEALEWVEWNKLERQSERCNNHNYEEYLVAWKQKFTQFHKWQNHATQSSEEKKDGRIECENGRDCYLHKHLDEMDNVRHALAVEAVAKVFLETVPSELGSVVTTQSDQSSKEPIYQMAQILKQAHGVAVWALSSNPGHSVQYHIDYAELLRYEYNVTVPPIWAGTVQCSALWNDRISSSDGQRDHVLPKSNYDQGFMKGGAFCVNLRGLEHYAEHGYKGNLSGDPMGGWRTPDDAVTGQYLDGGVHTNVSNQWVTIPYAFNRGIVHRGDLPHLSSPIKCIGTPDKDNVENGESGASTVPSRVIVGFNVFGHDVGARIAKAPEHSRPFRRKVRLYRSTINASAKGNTSDGGKSCHGGMDLSQIRKNKGLTKLLVLAKREKVKEELRRNQEQLSCRIWRRMLSHHGQDKPLLRVADFVEEFGRPNDGVDGTWPKSADIHVHLHYMLLSTKSAQEKTQERRSPVRNRFQDCDGIVGPLGAWYCIAKPPSDSSSGNGHSKSLSGGLASLSAELDIVECK
ncbi:hypothetical protein ACHAXR_004842 [Thalassiosira sp. AJA248-18]